MTRTAPSWLAMAGLNAALLALAGCRTAHEQPFPHSALQRPQERDGRVWVSKFELGRRQNQILHVVAAPEVSAVRLVPTSTDQPPDFPGYEPGPLLALMPVPERRWLVECEFEGSGPRRVGSIDVIDGGLMNDCGDSGGSSAVVAVGPPGFLADTEGECPARSCNDINEALGVQEAWLRRRAEERAREAKDPRGR